MSENRIDMEQGDFITIISYNGNSIKGVYTDQHGENTKFNIIGDMFLSENSIDYEVRERIIREIQEKKIEEIEDVSIKELIEKFNLFNKSVLEGINNIDPFEMDLEIHTDSKDKIVNAINFTQFVIEQVLNEGVEEGESEIDVLQGLLHDYTNYVEDVLKNGQEKEFYMIVQEWMSEEDEQ